MAPTAVHELDLPDFDDSRLNSSSDRTEALGALRAQWEHHWLAKTPLGFAVTRQEDVLAVLRDRRFHNALSRFHDEVAKSDTTGKGTARKSILVMEGDEHTRLRRLVSPAFSPRAADRLRPFMRDVAENLIEPLIPDGKCELVRDVCEPYPIPVICELLGAPKEDWMLFSQWAEAIFKMFNKDPSTDMPAVNRAYKELRDYVRALVEDRRLDLGEDLLSALIAAEEQGDRLDNDELVMLAESILMAGTDTTRNQLASSMAVFAEHPDQWTMLVEHPELAAQAAEECLRYVVAVRGTSRYASEDIEYRGVLFPKGTLVSTISMSANMDPDVWAVPDVFDITQKREAKNLTFGSGFHHCLGAALARAELQEALPVLAKRMPGLKLDGPIVWKPPAVGIWGPASLPLRF